MSASITNIADAEAARLTDEFLSGVLKRPVRASPHDPQVQEMIRIFSAAVRRGNGSRLASRDIGRAIDRNWKIDGDGT
jgi:hypothetical protein